MNTELTDTHDHATTDITVDGNAQVTARPDTILLRMELKGTAPAYDQALQAVDSRTRQLMEAMTECAIHETLVTERFDIEEVWRDRYDDSKRALEGYCAKHHVEVRMPLDMGLLNRFLQRIARSEIQPGIRVIFENRDPRPMMEEARVQALASARASAQHIAEQMGLKLTGIRSIRYTTPPVAAPFSLQVELPDLQPRACLSLDTSIRPDDVTVRDGVSVVWKAVAA